MSAQPTDTRPDLFTDQGNAKCADCGHDQSGGTPRVEKWLRRTLGMRPAKPYCRVNIESFDGFTPTERCYCDEQFHS